VWIALVRSLFNDHFAGTGIVTKDISVIYNDPFDKRQESDYGPFLEFEETDVNPWSTEV
jgi:uncharacterized protein (UPF0332 family)